MFNNVGEKIKLVAICVFIFSIILNVIGALWLCNIFDNIFNAEFATLILIFIVIAALGILLSWIFSLFIYGFGVLITNSEYIVDIHVDMHDDNDDNKEPVLKSLEMFK